MLTQERLKEVLVYDKNSGCFCWKGGLGNRIREGATAGTTTYQGYRQIKIDGKYYKAHRLAWLYEYGSMPTRQIDHIDGIRSNNAILNLRDVTSAINRQNMREARADNETGLLGVCKKGNKFRAQIKANGEVMQIGAYETAEIAHAAYVAAKRVLHSEGNTL